MTEKNTSLNSTFIPASVSIVNHHWSVFEGVDNFIVYIGNENTHLPSSIFLDIK